ncbi:MAG: hypothetical protein JWO66_2857 [Candidatus Eremiobacteraeota bacterium]|nr:hypothetical protein [Candidatus Eremiobacteraeota bacterium]
MIRPLTIFVAHPSDLLTDYLPHGDGLLAHAFIRRLAERGHTIEVAAPDVSLAEPLPPTVLVHRIRVRARGEMMRRIEYATRVRRLFAERGGRNRFDLIHQLNPVCTGLSLGLAGARVPVVLGPFVGHWPRDHGAPPIARWVLDGVAALQQRLASSLLVTTPAALSRIPLAEAERHKVVMLPYGIDTASFAPYDAAPHPPTILFLAHVERRKGIGVLLDAFTRVAARVPGVRLIVAGASEDDAVRARIAASDDAERITYLGPVERGSVPEIVSRCDVYCLPSFGEPYGMTAIEAMACGKPIVATGAGGLGHLVEPEGGIAVPPGDAAALADALVEVLTDPVAREAMGRHNRRVAETRYEWERVIDRLEEVYRSVASSMPSPSGALAEANSA